MKDLFSENSQLYRQARPSYSAEIIEHIMQHVPEHGLAWDCGAGSGQFSRYLAPYFQQVLATDLSAAQLAQAPQLANVRYLQASAEASGLAEQSVDLVTVAQAIHWFDFDTFYAKKVASGTVFTAQIDFFTAFIKEKKYTSKIKT